MKNLLTIILLLLSMTVFSQKEANNWLFGTRGGINFNCNPPMTFSGIKQNIQEGCASISDSNGNYLFATNGDSVWDKNMNGMPNGFDLAGKCYLNWNSGTQSALIVPKPGSSTLYYIFTTDCVEDTLIDGLQYSIVDMSLNNGHGDVILKNQLLFAPASEKVTAMKTGSNYWIVSHEFGTNNFYSYFLTNTGLSAPVISSTGQVHTYIPVTAQIHIPEQVGRGYLKFSPDGTKLISLELPDEHPYISQAYVLHPEIFSFNDTTGIIQSQYIIDHTDSIPYYGASFSADGSILYLSGAWAHQYLHQFNLLAGSQSAIVNSRTLINVDSSSNIYSAGAMQLAPDGKIYIANGYPWVDAINNPNGLGTSCNYQHKAIMLPTCPSLNYSNRGMPNFVESYFQTPSTGVPCSDFINTDFSYSDTCFNNVTQFYDSSTIFPNTINFWRWNFDDPASGSSNYSYLQNPTHIFSSIGTFNVQLVSFTDTTAFCKSDSLVQTVTIQPCTGVNEISHDNFNAVVFPNPTSSNFNLQIQTRGELTIQICIYTITGQMLQNIEQKISKSTSIQFGNDLATGMYMLQLRSDNLVFNRRLTKF
jgi:Secretion system C-terminal sorting domain